MAEPTDHEQTQAESLRCVYSESFEKHVTSCPVRGCRFPALTCLKALRDVYSNPKVKLR